MPPAGIRGYTIVGVGWRRAVLPIGEEQTGNGRDEGRDRHTVSEGVAFWRKGDKNFWCRAGPLRGWHDKNAPNLKSDKSGKAACPSRLESQSVEGVEVERPARPSRRRGLSRGTQPAT